MTYRYALIQIAVMAVATLLTRALPFLIFPANRHQPKILSYFSRVLPHAVMGMLLVYCLRSADVLHAPFALPELLAVAATAAVHLIKHNTVLSLTVGTVAYMVLIRVF